MRFAFTDEQLAFRDALRDLLARECPPSVVRDAWTKNGVDARKVWSHLAEIGVLGALAPTSSGGLGLTPVDLVLVLEETGYAALPEPIVEHAMVAVPLLEDTISAVSGALTITASDVEEIAPYGDRANRFLMLRDGCFHLFEGADAVVMTPEESVDGARRPVRVEWQIGRATPLGDAADAARGFDRGALGTAAQLVGLARRMLEMTVAYVGERRQFGVPVGSFQAVKHHLADARIAIEFARPLVYRAAWSIAEDDPDHPVHVSMAKATAGDGALLTARRALQCHGAIGYSFEYDLHLFMKRAWALAATWGDAAWHRARVGRAIL